MEEKEQLMIQINYVSKVYKLGEIGGTTLRESFQRLFAKILHKEDPTKKIGAKNYNKGEKFLALDNINLAIKKGERVGIIGHNGAGKSTLLKLICRVTAPTTGEIGLNGRITSMLEVGTGFHPELTGRENIYVNGAILGMTKKEIDEVIEDIIEFSEVREFIDTPVKRYSSGMYVKLAFSVAAHLKSEIMIMDEVLAVGDVAFQNKCLTKMRSVSEDEGRTILYVSHNMNTIRDLCNRVVVLKKGRIIFDGDTEKGISYYCGSNHDNFPAIYEISNVDRPSSFHGKDIRISSVVFAKKMQAIYEQNEKIVLNIEIDSFIDCNHLELLFTLKSINNGLIGSTQTDKANLSFKKNKRYILTLEFPTQVLAPDDYMFSLDLFAFKESNEHLSYDHPIENFYFKIQNITSYKGINWQSKYYGNIILDSINLLYIESDNS